MKDCVLPLADVRATDSAVAGGKAACLGELAAAGFPVPPGFVVLSHAGHAFFETVGVARDVAGLQSLPPADLASHCSALQRRIVGAELPAPLADAILEAHGRLMAVCGADTTCAVRSSATAEDLPGASFAGQHGTYYYVDAGRLLEMIRHCWASLWSREAVSYRSTHGIPHESVRMAVVVQEMVRADVSGVAFTANPVTGERGEVVIEASFGMGAAIVDGRVTPDRYVVARDGLGLRERRIAQKRLMVPTRLAREGADRLVAVPHERQRSESLGAEQVRTVARWALRCEVLFGAPQDVEWAIAGDRFHLLQSRPVTTLGRDEDPREVKGKWVLFKAIAENFTDPITPLTADLLSVLLGPGLRFIGGRLYMNLELLAPLVPFEMSDEDMANAFYLSPRSTAARLSLRKLPLTLLAGLLFYLSAGVLLARTRGMPDDFMAAYRSLCRRVGDDPNLDAVQALQRVTVLPRLLDPLGHMAMMVNVSSLRFAPWMTALKHMLGRWVPRLRPDAVALLSSGSEGVLSAEMGRGIRALAAEARRDASARDILSRHEPGEALAQLRQDPGARGFVERLDAFLAMHGHRAIKEFEIRTARWEEDPTPVLGMIRNGLLAGEDDGAREHKAARERLELESDVRTSLQALPLEGLLGLRGRLVQLAARRARYYLKLRENSRFYHIMAIGLLRRKVLAIEAELRGQGRLRCKDDIFFLTWNEAKALRAGALGWTEVEDRIRQRRLEHVRLAKVRPPRTIGIALTDAAAAGTATVDRLEGQPASPGRYEGVARVILDPSVDLTLRPGEVLVAPYTDPAWTPLFLVAGAAVVEVGSYLSHAGTVAREYGLPCVVDVPDCTRRIRSGARVQVDGSTGIVRILEETTA